MSSEPHGVSGTDATDATAMHGARELHLLLDDTAALLRRYVILRSDDEYVALSLWIAHTYVFDSGYYTPRLAIISVEPGSGKTLVLELLRLLVREPRFTANTSEAALFRRIPLERPTMLLDECDATFHDRSEKAQNLRGIIDSGYQQGGVTTRCVGKDFTPTDFDVFCPMALAGIGKLPETVMDRSVVLRMRRRRSNETIDRFYRRDIEPACDPIRQELATWSATVGDTLSNARPDFPASLPDRPANLWELLLAIADLAGHGWGEKARRASVDLAAASRSRAMTPGVALLHDIRTVVDDWPHQNISTKSLLQGLGHLDDGLCEGPPLDPQRLARTLRDYDIRPGTLRCGHEDKKRKGYRISDLADAFERYLQPPGEPVAPVAPVAVEDAASPAESPSSVPDLTLPSFDFPAGTLIADYTCQN